MIEKIPAESKVETGSRVIISLAKGNSPAAAHQLLAATRNIGGEAFRLFD
jgi:hypothetical protein